MTTLTHPQVPTTGKRLDIPLSKLIASRHNPRKVKPERDAHRRLVASIRAHGLLQPLVVQAEGEGRYLVIAGNRRLAALREIFKGHDPKIGCVLKQVESEDAYAAALAENFAREPMHPLDEAEAFARLARDEGHGAEDIASQFGVSPGYVRQRMKLAALADVLKAAYRDGTLDTGMAEAFAAVPEDKQREVWEELRGQPQHAEQVRNVIANAWIDAQHALFDIATLPPEKVSHDLFGERVLIERHAFFAAQAEALEAQQRALQEEGWSEVVICARNDVHDRLWRMAEAPVCYDEGVTKRLAKLEKKREELEAQWEAIADGDAEASDAVQAKLDKLDAQADALTKEAQPRYAEDVKAVGTAFLLVCADGEVQRAYRMPRPRHHAEADTNSTPSLPKAPTADDLRDSQLVATFAHEALAVREALLKDSMARKRVLVLALHEKVRKEALAITPDANATTLHAENTEGFASTAFDTLRQRRTGLDPFREARYVDEAAAYAQLGALSESRLDELIALLTAELVTSHPQHRVALVHALAGELGVNVRQHWRPDAAWLGSYQKAQLASLMAELLGPVYTPATDTRKKSELVESLVTLFTDAAEGRLEQPHIAERVNRWLPANLRDEPPPAQAVAA